jgi:A/G-specific adenine glycosylase
MKTPATQPRISQARLQRFQQRVITFYKEQGRVLPWRQTIDPYKILVSEVMLQQTQVSRVIPFYEKWIETWPTVQSLANASRPEVLRAWMGLGYNRRAMNLHRAAGIIQGRFAGDVLEAMRHFDEVPGVGRYTAQAVRIFASNENIVTVDTNIRRIFLVEFALPSDTKERVLWDLAARCLPKERSRDWHNALMDYGALHETARRTKISPLTRQSRFEGSTRQLRARVLRLLLDAPRTIGELQPLLRCNKGTLSEVLSRMCKDGILTYEGTRYAVAKD